MKKTIISIRLSQEEEEILNNKCNARGIDRSSYIRELIFCENSPMNQLYSQKVRELLNEICNVCVDIRDNSRENLELGIKEMEGKVIELWQFLR